MNWVLCANTREHGLSGYFEGENCRFSRAKLPLHDYSFVKFIHLTTIKEQFRKIIHKISFLLLIERKTFRFALESCKFPFRLLKGPMSVYFSYLDHSVEPVCSLFFDDDSYPRAGRMSDFFNQRRPRSLALQV